MIGLPFRIASRAPEIAIGTIGTPARIAITKAPLRNGSSSPVRERVPSGKTKNEPPAFSRATAWPTARVVCSRLPRSIGMKPTRSKPRFRIGSLRSSAL